MNELSIDNLRGMWNRALQDIQVRAEEFSQLDAVAGDGDHGEAIVTAMTALVSAGQGAATVKAMLNDMAFAVMLNTSGSTSTLLGALLLGMSDGAADKASLSAKECQDMFTAGLESVKKNTQAKVGDKTMMDALIPAVNAIEAYTGEDIVQMMQKAAEQAEFGAGATVAMQARFGRARNLGEKSRGSMDSGAASWSAMFRAFATELQS